MAEANISSRDRYGSATVNLHRARSLTAVVPATPTLYALIIGIGTYFNNSLSLQNDFPAHDADNFATELQKQQGLAFNKVLIYKSTLEDSMATSDNIKDGLEWLEKNAQDASDVALIYFSGHGKDSYLLPFNFDGSETKTGIFKGQIIDALARTNGRAILVIDACQAAAGLDIKGLVNDARSTPHAIMSILSSMPDQPSLGDVQLNSYFTTALIQALEGNGLLPQYNDVLTSDIASYLTRRLKDKDLGGGKQTASVVWPVNWEHFRIAVVKK